LQRGDHPFITHDCAVYYQQAQELPVQEIETMRRQDPVSGQLLSRIRQGLHRSKFTKRGLKSKVPQR
jgi:hypothetical protein